MCLNSNLGFASSVEVRALDMVMSLRCVSYIHFIQLDVFRPRVFSHRVLK